MDSFCQPGILQNIGQQHLSEVSLDLGVAGQGIGQVLRLIPDCLRLFHHVFDAHPEGFIPDCIFLLGFPDRPVELGELLLDRLQKLRDGFRALLAESAAVLGGKCLEGILHVLKVLLVLFLLRLEGGFLFGQA